MKEKKLKMDIYSHAYLGNLPYTVQKNLIGNQVHNTHSTIDTNKSASINPEENRGHFYPRRMVRRYTYTYNIFIYI